MQTHKQTIKHVTLAIGTMLLFAVAVLWSWNTLADAIVPVGKLNYVQALAVVLLLGVTGFLLRRPRRGRWGQE